MVGKPERQERRGGVQTCASFSPRLSRWSGVGSSVIPGKKGWEDGGGVISRADVDQAMPTKTVPDGCPGRQQRHQMSHPEC